MTRSITPITTLADYDLDEDLPQKHSYCEPVNTASPMHEIQNVNDSQHHFNHLLTKPSDGIPIPNSVPHMAAFCGGNCSESELDALAQALFKHIKIYKSSPTLGELRSTVTGLVEQCTNSESGTGRIELLVNRLCYLFTIDHTDEFPAETIFHQPNKRKRGTRDDDTNKQSSTKKK